MGYLELFGLIVLGTIVAMLCWGKLLDRGIATDRAREFFPMEQSLTMAKTSLKYALHSSMRLITRK